MRDPPGYYSLPCSINTTKKLQKLASPHPPPRLGLSPGELWTFLSFNPDLYLFCLFLEWESGPNLAPAPFDVPKSRASHIRKNFLDSCRSMSWIRLRNPPPWTSAQPNTALDYFISRPICVSFSFLLGAPRAPRPLECIFLLVGFAWLRSR